MSVPPAAPLTGQRVLVTGGAGFIGSHLVERLVAEGCAVTVIDNLTTGSTANLEPVLPRITLLRDDLGALLAGGRLRLDEYSHIFHLAGNAYIPPSIERPLEDFAVNLQLTMALIEALRSVESRPRLIYSSSAAVYGNPARLPICEDDPTVPISPYGVGKLAAERYIAVYSRTFGLHATTLRFFSIYGPRQRKQVVYDLLRKLARDPHRLEVYGDGSQGRDFVYVSDVIQALILAAERAPGRGEVYNVASGTTHTIRQLVAGCCELLGRSPRVVYSGRVRSGDADFWSVDIGRLRALGYEAAVPLVSGLSLAKAWFDAAPE